MWKEREKEDLMMPKFLTVDRILGCIMEGDISG